ncbi:MAG: hypothetical protein ACTHZX_09335 [Microbacterium sp.]
MPDRIARELSKRAANESVARILEADDLSQTTSRRPGAIVGGCVLVGLRAAGGVLSGISLGVTWPAGRDALGLEPGPESVVVLGVVLSFLGAAMLLLLVLALLVWRRSNAARLLVMFWVSASIIGAAIDHFSDGVIISFRTTLVTLSLDILVLLALSSRNARAWSRGGPRRATRGRDGAVRAP